MADPTPAVITQSGSLYVRLRESPNASRLRECTMYDEGTGYCGWALNTTDEKAKAMAHMRLRYYQDFRLSGHHFDEPPFWVTEYQSIR